MQFKISGLSHASGAKFYASSKSALEDFVPLQNFRSQLRSVEFFGGADGGAKSAPSNPARITPTQIPMLHAETHNLISLQDRLRNSTTSLVA